MNGTAGAKGKSWRSKARSYLPIALSAIPVVVIPALEWIPGISERWRAWLIIGSLCLAAVGIIWGGIRGKTLEDLRQENQRLRSEIMQADPEHFLQQIASALFRDGAWRVAVLSKSHRNNAGHVEVLQRLASSSSDFDHTRLGPASIPLHPGTLFAHIFSSNLADPRFRQAGESGSYPGDPLSHEWATWRDGIFGHRGDANDDSSLRPRKYAWFAAQDPKSSRVYVVLAESTAEEGIAVDLLNHPFTPSWLFFVARLAELREVAR